MNVQGQRAAIENQLVVPSDAVAVHQGRARIHGHGAEHLQSACRFALVEWRGAEVDDHVDPLAGQFFNWIPVVDILANGDAEPTAIPCDRFAGFAGLKIASLVKNIIGRQ